MAQLMPTTSTNMQQMWQTEKNSNNNFYMHVYRFCRLVQISCERVAAVGGGRQQCCFGWIDEWLDRMDAAMTHAPARTGFFARSPNCQTDVTFSFFFLFGYFLMLVCC